MSTRTVGKYRPHLTCVQKSNDNKGVCVTVPLPLENQRLPLLSEPKSYQQECYRRLVAATCAAIPSCFAAHEISRDRVPNSTLFASLSVMMPRKL